MRGFLHATYLLRMIIRFNHHPQPTKFISYRIKGSIPKRKSERKKQRTGGIAIHSISKHAEYSMTHNRGSIAGDDEPFNCFQEVSGGRLRYECSGGVSEKNSP
jgi:hypothetical protein